MKVSRPERPPAPRVRMTREARSAQLVETAWRLVRDGGTDALTLGRVAEQAGVSKPVVYDHFGTRTGLLTALYQEYDTRQTALMDAALASSAATLPDRAAVIATSYVECVLVQGRELPGVIAALTGSPELEKVRAEWESVFLAKVRAALEPFVGSGTVSGAGLRAMLGAADALSAAAANGEITAEEAADELAATIVAMVERARGRSSSEPARLG